MYVDQTRAPDLSEIRKGAQKYRTEFLAAGCRVVTSRIKSIFVTLIAAAYTNGRSIVRFFNTSVLRPEERRG